MPVRARQKIGRLCPHAGACRPPPEPEAPVDTWQFEVRLVPGSEGGASMGLAQPLSRS